MAVKSNLSDGLVNLNITDTTLLFPASVRFAVTAAVLNNTASAARTVRVYESPDLTIAAGTLIATITLNALESLPIEEIIGQSYTVGSNLIGIAVDGSDADVNSRITYSWFTGDS